MSHPPLKRRLLLVAVTVLIGVAGFVVGAPPATAAPGDPPDETGGNASLLAAVAAASKAYLEAKGALEASQGRQAELAVQVLDAERRLASMSDEAQTIALAAYRMRGMRTASALLSSTSAESFMDRVTTLEVIARRQNGILREFTQARKRLADAKAASDAEVTKQQQHLALMAKQKAAAEKALAAYGAEENGPTNGGSGTAQPAPKRSGSWPPESCRVKDPTTSGCLTPRTLHALQQAKGAGFTRYVSCHRSGGGGEHPKVARVTSRPIRTASVAWPPATTVSTATTWRRTSSATPMPSPCST